MVESSCLLTQAAQLPSRAQLLTWLLRSNLVQHLALALPLPSQNPRMCQWLMALAIANFEVPVWNEVFFGPYSGAESSQLTKPQPEVAAQIRNCSLPAAAATSPVTSLPTCLFFSSNGPPPRHSSAAILFSLMSLQYPSCCRPFLLAHLQAARELPLWTAEASFLGLRIPNNLIYC